MRRVVRGFVCGIHVPKQSDSIVRDTNHPSANAIVYVCLEFSSYGEVIRTSGE